MTNQEAYDHIKSRLKEYIQCTADNIALYTALKALEKQIAKEKGFKRSLLVILFRTYGYAPLQVWDLVLRRRKTQGSARRYCRRLHIARYRGAGRDKGIRPPWKIPKDSEELSSQHRYQATSFQLFPAKRMKHCQHIRRPRAPSARHRQG